MAFPCESATVDCVATLEYPRYSPLDNRAVFFDALTLCYNETYGENRPIVCSVRFDRSSEHDILEVGAYQIVLLFIPFRPNIHVPSPVRHAAEFMFMGDIQQIKPLDDVQQYRLYMGLPASHIFAWGGVVHHVNYNDCSFYASVAQKVKGIAPLVVTIRACVRLGIHRMLPHEDEVVFLWGALSRVHGTCPEVTLEDLIPFE